MLRERTSSQGLGHHSLFGTGLQPLGAASLSTKTATTSRASHPNRTGEAVHLAYPNPKTCTSPSPQTLNHEVPAATYLHTSDGLAAPADDVEHLGSVGVPHKQAAVVGA